MTEHNVLTDPELHEPKGIAAASDNQVYVADGAAGGAFAQITPTNRVMVHSASDLPSAAAGVRTLLAATTYQVVGSVSIGSDRLVMGADTVLRGCSPMVDSLVTTSSGAMITSTENGVMSGLGFTCSSGAWLSLTGAGVDSFDISNCRVASCDTLGTVTTMHHFHWSDSEVVACTTTGITFAGTSGDLIIRGCELDSTLATILDLGSSVWGAIYIIGNILNNPSGVDAITVAASGANLAAGGIGFILDNFIETVATATSGYTVGDLKWIVKGNPGVENNTGGAQGSIVDSALNTSFSGTGAGNDVVVNFGTAWVADISDKFTQTTAGVFTYTGVIPIKVMVNATMFAIVTGGAARTYNYYVAKGGTIVASSVSQREYDGTNIGANSCKSLLDLVTGNTITLKVRAETATTDLNVDTCSISIHEV